MKAAHNLSLSDASQVGSGHYAAFEGGAGTLAQELAQTAEELAVLLAHDIGTGGFPDRTYYGEAFALWLWTCFPGVATDQAVESALVGVLARDSDAPQAHHEFNNLALLHYFKATGDERVLPPLAEMRVRNNRMPNWALLRTHGRLLHNYVFEQERFDEQSLHIAVKRLLLHLMRPYGLICDTRYLCEQFPMPVFDRSIAGLVDPALDRLKRIQELARPTRSVEDAFVDMRAKLQVYFSRSTSFMYHCFDLTSLYSIAELTGWEVAEDAFREGIEFISDLMLRNGDTMYVGRGQQQLFPYGALIFSLCAAATKWGDGRFLTAAERAFRFVESHRRPDGTFPLVVRQGESGWPVETERAASPAHPGWYRYNNFYDYQTAFGLFLAKTAEVLQKRPQLAAAPHEPPVGLTVYGREMATWRDDRWEAVVSVPGGYWANAMPLPYICTGDKSVTPCYGGERLPPTLYSAEMIPLPQAMSRSGRCVCFAERLNYRLDAEGDDLILEGRGRGISHHRRFIFDRGTIEVRDKLTLSRSAASTFSYISPLVIWGLRMDEVGEYTWRIHAHPTLTLRVEQVEGGLEHLRGYCARGPIEGIRETVPSGTSQREFERMITFTVE